MPSHFQEITGGKAGLPEAHVRRRQALDDAGVVAGRRRLAGFFPLPRRLPRAAAGLDAGEARPPQRSRGHLSESENSSREKHTTSYVS